MELDVNSQMALEEFLNIAGTQIPISGQQCTTADAQGNLLEVIMPNLMYHTWMVMYDVAYEWLL